MEKQMKQKTTLSINVNGNHVAVFIDGLEKIDIKERYYSFWNHQATNGSLHWVYPYRAYFWSEPRLLKAAVIQIVLCEIINKYDCKYKGVKYGPMPLARKIADRAMRNIKRVPAKYGVKTRKYNDTYYSRYLDDSFGNCSFDVIQSQEEGIMF
jgi:hypothetical protein